MFRSLGFYFTVLLTLGSFLTGCAVSDNPALDTFKDAFHIQSGNKRPPVFNNHFNYLAITLDGREVFLASVPQKNSSTSKDWYSANHETMTLTQGRLESIHGVLTEWHHVDLNHAPSWQDLILHPRAVKWVRYRDVMPGYVIHERDDLAITPQGPDTSASLHYHQGNQLQWFREINVNHPELGTTTYALLNTPHALQVVYSRFCLSSTFCLSWEQVPNPQSGQL